MLLFFHLPVLTRTLLIVLITLFTLVGIMTHPWKLNEMLFALTGAGLLLILGLTTPGAAVTTLMK